MEKDVDDFVSRLLQDTPWPTLSDAMRVWKASGMRLIHFLLDDYHPAAFQANMQLFYAAALRVVLCDVGLARRLAALYVLFIVAWTQPGPRQRRWWVPIRVSPAEWEGLGRLAQSLKNSGCPASFCTDGRRVLASLFRDRRPLLLRASYPGPVCFPSIAAAAYYRPAGGLTAPRQRRQRHEPNHNHNHNPAGSRASTEEAAEQGQGPALREGRGTSAVRRLLRGPAPELRQEMRDALRGPMDHLRSAVHDTREGTGVVPSAPAALTRALHRAEAIDLEEDNPATVAVGEGTFFPESMLSWEPQLLHPMRGYALFPADESMSKSGRTPIGRATKASAAVTEAVARGSRRSQQPPPPPPASSASASAASTAAESLVARSQTRGSGPWSEVSRRRKNGGWGLAGAGAVEGCVGHVSAEVASRMRQQKAARQERGWEGVSDATDEDDLQRTKVPLRRAKSVLSLTPKKRRQRTRAHLQDRYAPEGLGFVRVRQAPIGSDVSARVPGSIASVRVLRSILGAEPGQAPPPSKRRRHGPQSVSGESVHGSSASSSSGDDSDAGGEGRADDSSDSALRELNRDLMGLSEDSEDSEDSDGGAAPEQEEERDDDWL